MADEEDDATFKIVKKLGEGGFGQVFLIERKDDPSTKHAMKVMDTGSMDEDDAERALTEINLLSSLNHKHLLHYVECFRQDEQLCIVTEYCPNGDLSEYIEDQRGTKLEEPRLVEWFRQIASAVEYLHSKNIIHRDLKLANVFLNKDMDCVLGDLGIARILESNVSFAQTQIGTFHYMSPEVFMGIPYNFKTDVWSLAVLIYELAALEKPFDHFFEQGLVFKICREKTPDMPEGYCSEFSDLLTEMMKKDPNDRPSSADILKHALFQKKKKPKPMPNLKMEVTGSDEYDGGFPLILSLLSTFSHLSAKPRGKRGKGGAQGVTSVKKLVVMQEEEEEEEEDNPEIAHVTRTLKSMGLFGPEKVYEKGRTGILRRNVDQLKIYCLQVLNNDNNLFERASRELDEAGDDEDLEEKLIGILGHEKFGMCGVQLLHYKNYSFNLRNL